MEEETKKEESQEKSLEEKLKEGRVSGDKDDAARFLVVGRICACDELHASIGTEHPEKVVPEASEGGNRPLLEFEVATIPGAREHAWPDAEAVFLKTGEPSAFKGAVGINGNEGGA